jgi:hypothetical protein
LPLFVSRSHAPRAAQGKTGAPLVADARVCIELKKVKEIDNPSNTMFVGEIVATHVAEEAVTDGKVRPPLCRPSSTPKRAVSCLVLSRLNNNPAGRHCQAAADALLVCGAQLPQRRPEDGHSLAAVGLLGL